MIQFPKELFRIPLILVTFTRLNLHTCTLQRSTGPLAKRFLKLEVLEFTTTV